MQPTTRHDIALFLARSLAYQPFIAVCSLLSGWTIAILFGTSSLPEVPQNVLSFSALGHLTLSRLLAFFVLWRLAPVGADWISTIPRAFQQVTPGSDVTGTPWAANPFHT